MVGDSHPITKKWNCTNFVHVQTKILATNSVSFDTAKLFISLEMNWFLGIDVPLYHYVWVTLKKRSKEEDPRKMTPYKECLIMKSSQVTYKLHKQAYQRWVFSIALKAKQRWLLLDIWDFKNSFLSSVSVWVFEFEFWVKTGQSRF